MKTTGAGRERSFGLTVGTVCCLCWVVSVWRGRGNPWWLGGLGGLLLLTAAIAPAWLRVPSALWRKFADVVGWINARVILTLAFFVVFMPVGLVMRLLGRDLLRLRRSTRSTYWEPYPARLRQITHYERMF